MIPAPSPRLGGALARVAAWSAARVVVLAGLLGAAPAAAHLAAGAKPRDIVASVEDGALIVHVRTPAPLVFSDVVAAALAGSRPLETPLLYAEPSGVGVRYRIAMDAVAADPERWRARVAGALVFSQHGRPLAVTVEAARLRLRAPQAPFVDPAAALAVPQPALDPVFGDAYIEARLRLDAPTPLGALRIAAGALPLPLPPDVVIDNHIRDLRFADAASLTVEGQLTRPVTLAGDAWRDAAHTVGQGVWHGAAGLDHALLAACLVAAAGATRRLGWLVAAFALGHGVAVLGAVAGATPSWPWIAPVGDAAVAATVVYAAVAALRGWPVSVAAVSAAGALHGLAVSAAVGAALGLQAADLVPALSAFSIGVALGFLAVVGVVLAVAAAVRAAGEGAAQAARLGALAGCAGFGAFQLAARLAALA